MKQFVICLLLMSNCLFISCGSSSSKPPSPEDMPQIEVEIRGCIDKESCNYNPNATVDDGSCEYTSCAGCMDPSSCNYDATATIDDGSCETTSCAGCTDQLARNYDSTATIDNGTCNFNCTITGEIRFLSVTTAPADNVKMKYEILVDNEVVLRTKNKTFVSGSTLYFNQEDYDFNIEGGLNIMRFSKDGSVMKIKLFIDDQMAEESEYDTCYFTGDIYIVGNAIPKVYYVSGPNCGNGNCLIGGGIAFKKVEVFK